MHQLTSELKVGILSVGISGYCDETCGDALMKLIRKALEEDKAAHFILDFSECSVVNSPGIAQVVEGVELIHIDFQGQVAICGLDATQKSFFRMTGIFEMAMLAEDRVQATHLLSK